MKIHSHFSSDFLVIYLRVVQGCNLNCAHCFTLGNKDPHLLVDLNHVEKFLRSIIKNVSPRKAVVYIHGGETFLAPLSHLSAVNKIVRRELAPLDSFNIIPQTNLMYSVDETYLRFIKTEYGSQIGISWDPKIRFRTTTNDLGETLFFENFEKLISFNLDVAVAITVQKHLLKLSPLAWLSKFQGAKSLDFEYLTFFDQKTRSLKVNNDSWSKYLLEIVDYYLHQEPAPSWSLPQIDLFTKSLVENKIFNCKGNCCKNRTFTLNCNGKIGLCPDEAYISPISNVKEIDQDWPSFEKKAREAYLHQLALPLHPLCTECEFFEACGGNCELELFDAESKDCPMSKATLSYQMENINGFLGKLENAKSNLVELRNTRPSCH